MFDKLKKITNARFRKTNINSFIFFLLFAVVIWFFVQFSKQYNEIINIPVQYVNVPPNKLVTNDNPRSIKLRMEENGFRIAWFSLFPPTLEVDITKANDEDGKLVYVFDENREDILSQLNINFDNSRFVKDALEIDYEQRQEKTLPVTSRIETEYAAGYGAVEGLKLKPDSVTVSGPANILDTLSSLYTQPLKLKNIKQNVSGTVRLDTSALRNVSVYRNQVEYTVDVEKSTEGSVVVPIELINVPKGLNVVIFPKETLLFFQVNLNDYNKVTASDFRVVADFSELRDNQDFLIPKLVQKPDFTTNIRLNEKKIQFIIKK